MGNGTNFDWQQLPQLLGEMEKQPSARVEKDLPVEEAEPMPETPVFSLDEDF